MQNSAVIRLIEGRLVWYPPGAGDSYCYLDEELSQERFRAAAGQPGSVFYFAVPGADVTLYQMDVSAEERKHIGKALPFRLEESLAADIEDLHFASAFEGTRQLAAAVCTRDKMLHWQALLADFPMLTQWIPEPLLLPWQPGEWCLLMEDDRAMVRTGSFSGLCIESELLQPMLAAALAESDRAPESLVIYGQDQEGDTARIPEPIRDRVQWRRGDLASALLLSQSPPHTFNLLQGAFALRLPLERWWKQWRAVAAVLALALTVQLLATYAEFATLARENVALRYAVEQSYRKAYPRGALVDAEKQLSRQLGSLRGSGQSSGFVSLMSRVGEIISGHPGTRISTINYNDKGDEIRMNITARDFEAVEDIRTALNRAGLTAKMESSSAQGEQVRARLRVGTGS
ncbi:MAG: type II secretion system protein GspL [Proteobacteria bacterium]|nr:type II secretion system protein GspL [Pseudomonadota bacterium]